MPTTRVPRRSSVRLASRLPSIDPVRLTLRSEPFDDQARTTSTQEWLRGTPLGAGARVGQKLIRDVGAKAIKHIV